MDELKDFKRKNLGKISSIILTIFNLASILLAIISIITNNRSPNWIIIYIIIIINCIFLVICTFYEGFLLKRSNDIIKQAEDNNKLHILNLEMEKNVIEKEMNQVKKFSNDLSYYNEYMIGTLNKFMTQLYNINGKYQERIEEILIYGEDLKSEANLKVLKDSARTDYEQTMLTDYNHFLSNMSSRLKPILDSKLDSKGLELKVSIAVKQFNRIVTDDITDVKVITTFRNHETYSQGKREIGCKEYNIHKNTDFIHCLNSPYFLSNNMEPNSPNYNNEHKGFEKFYNCTIVVPIFCQYPDSKILYGYLACDVLNNDKKINSILDDEMAKIMVATGNIIGIYFESMAYQWEWENMLSDDFIKVIYKMKLVKEKR